MSRPVGRYFAPLIKKIKALQQEEKIEIDEKFKMEFRAKLLSRASSADAPSGILASQADDNSQISDNKLVEKTEASFSSRFRKFSMFFAAIPAVLVLVVVAYSINNFSALINSSNKNSTVYDSSFSSDQATIDENQNKVSSENKEQDNLIEFSPKTDSSPNALEKQQSSSSTSQTNQAEQSQKTSSHVPIVIPNDDKTPSNVPSAGGGTDLENTTLSGTNNTAGTTTSPALNDENTRSMESSSASLMIEAPEESSADSGSTENSAAPSYSHQTTAFAPSAATYNTMAPNPTPTIVNPYIYFSGSLSQNQKDYFEKTLIPSLLQGKTLEFANVKEKNGVVTVTIYFKDKSKSISTYIYDTYSNQWVNSQVTNQSNSTQSNTSQTNQTVEIQKYKIETMPSFEYTKANEK